jgi:hypothetical protein
VGYIDTFDARHKQRSLSQPGIDAEVVAEGLGLGAEVFEQFLVVLVDERGIDDFGPPFPPPAVLDGCLRMCYNRIGDCDNPGRRR